MKYLKKTFLLVLVLLLISSCTTIKHYVSYTVYPIGFLLNRIGGDRITTMSVQDNSIVELANAKEDFNEIINDSLYLFHISGLEPYFDLHEEEIKKSKVKVIDLSELNAIYKFQRYSVVYNNDGETYIESPYYDSPLFDDVDSYDLDLFLWLDPIGMLSMAKDVYSVLASNYSEQASYFKENYEKLSDELIVLDASYHQLSNELKKENKSIKFVSMTPSFGSWQKSYGFNVYPICLSKYGILPTDEQLEVIKERIIKDDVKYIAFEPNMSEDMKSLFDRLENELGLQRINLSNISSLDDTSLSDGKDYLTLMYENLMVLENIAVDNDDSKPQEDKPQVEQEIIIEQEEVNPIEITVN